MSPSKNHEEPLIKRLARSRCALSSRPASRDPSMSPTRYEASVAGAGPAPVHYLPYAFILPNYGQVSVSLPTLNTAPPPPGLLPPAPATQRKLSKLSNLVWTVSASQPDLGRPTTTLSPSSRSPAASLPTSRASSPAPASISARCSPGQGPSPYLSPLDSRQDLAQPGAAQDVLYLNSALNHLALTQARLAPYPPHPTVMEVAGPGQPQFNYAASPGYYAQEAVTWGSRPPDQAADPRSGSCSPRQVSFPRRGSGPALDPKKPCAVIAPSPASQQPHQAGSCGRQSAEAAVIRNSSPVPSVKLDNELVPPRPRPLDHLRPASRDIGTSCSDLGPAAAAPPFVVETCQICSLFHPRPRGGEAELGGGAACLVYSPCLHGDRVVPRSQARPAPAPPTKLSTNSGSEQIKR